MPRAAILVGHPEGIVKYLHDRRTLRAAPRWFESEAMAEFYLASVVHILRQHGFIASIEVEP